ncbi:MAG: ACT domain-containing protein, partial [Lysobacteraceae bacterium]
RSIDRANLIKDVSTLIAKHGVHVLELNSRVDSERGLAELRLGLKVSDYEQLGQLLGRLHALPGVHEARRRE